MLQRFAKAIFGNANSGATRLDLTLADLAAGSYTITTYHHDGSLPVIKEIVDGRVMVATAAWTTAA